MKIIIYSVAWRARLRTKDFGGHGQVIGLKEIASLTKKTYTYSMAP